MAWYAANKLGAKKVALFFADAGSAISVADVLRAARDALRMEIVADVTFTEESARAMLAAAQSLGVKGGA